MLSPISSKPTIIACDYSGNNDRTKGDGITYTEPTLYYRMIYELHPASEIAARLNLCTSIDHCLETYDMMAPSGGKTIILAPKYAYGEDNNGFQSNYYVGTSALARVTNGKWYEVLPSGEKTALNGTLYNAKQYEFTGSFFSGKHTYVLVSTVGGVDYYIAKFSVDYQDEKAVGPSATEIHSDTYLNSHYKEIAARRFDFNEPVDDYQAWSEPLSFDESTYGFIYHPQSYTVNNSNNSTLDLTNINPTSINWANYAFLSSSRSIGNWAYPTFHDRLYERTGKRGYFYYVDAAETQGLVAKLDISHACCAGTELYFSAWVANVNQEHALQPNLNFEITALDDSGAEFNVKTFTTGNFGNTSNTSDNHWMQVFFHFEIPRGTNYQKLYLKVINNQISSLGDDFIFDDLVVYMEKPAIEVEQTRLLCGPTAQVKVHVDYNQMLKLTAMEGLSTANSLTIGYCFVDSTKYMSEIHAGIDKAVALSDARVKINNSTVPGNSYIGQFLLQYDPNKTVSELYSDVPAGEDNSQIITDLQKSPYAYHEIHNEKDELFYILEITGYDLKPGRRYYTIFNIKGTAIDDMASYSIDKSCDAYTSFILKGTGRIIVDGATDLYEENGNHCYNQSPTFSVGELNYVDKDGNTAWVKTQDVGLYFDWYKGTEIEYHNSQYTDGSSTFSAADALLAYRLIYPTQSDYTLPALGNYTAAMRQVIMTLSTDSRGDDNTLVLKKKTYSPNIVSLGEYDYLAIPVVATFTDPDNNYSVCLDEQQIIYNATDQAPKILCGIQNITYGSRSVVPIRLGQNQMQQATSAEKIINIPIRQVSVVTPDSHIITLHDSNHSLMGENLFLSDTDDPSMVDSALNFKKVGIIKALNADNRLTNTPEKLNNLMQIYFDNAFASSIKEGYTYKMKLYYAERNVANTDYTNTCEGNSYLVFKVVPAYETWHGGASANNQDWNNDINWRRSDNTELYKATTAYTSNTVNTTANGFVPLDFTNFTILKGDSVSSVPSLRSHTLNTDHVLNLDATATTDIAYDMILTADGNNFGCKSYYENKCNDVYLKPEAELMNAQLLSYQRAHIDYELTPNRWYLLSSPLQDVYAGDMYAPKGTARQETDAFTDITFDNTLSANNRFDPAVYQRSWDKNTSLVYTYLPYETDNQHNVYTRANWSYVYNDVDVSYAPGNGFSIKAVPGTSFTSGSKVLFRLPKSDTEYSYFTKGGTAGSTKSIDRTGTGKLFTDILTGSNKYTATVSVTNSSPENNLYLVGNPFPCELNMNAFLTNTSNASLVDSKYWLMTADGQDAVVFGDNSVSTANTPGTTVAPMQGFFVKLKDGVSNTGTLTLTFNDGMMGNQRAGISPPPLRAKSMNSSPCSLYLSASCNGLKSRMVLVRSSSASDSFVNSEDVELLDNSLVSDVPLIYSIAGSTAAQINQFRSNTMIPVGVMHGDSDLIKVSITGIHNFEEPISLYDTVSRTAVPLRNDTTVTFANNVPDRYFISFSPSTAISTLVSSSTISFYTRSDGAFQVVSSSSPLSDIQIYGAGGQMIAHRSPIDSVCETFHLPSGLYIIRARNKQSIKTGKLTVH